MMKGMKENNQIVFFLWQRCVIKLLLHILHFYNLILKPPGLHSLLSLDLCPSLEFQYMTNEIQSELSQDGHCRT